jgi:predicted nucleic acid-binding protein
MLRALPSDRVAGVLEMVAPNWAAVHRIADGLSAKYTEADGHRLADILHVATALHLAAEQFLTFDGKQRKLAAAEGMIVPV